MPPESATLLLMLAELPTSAPWVTLIVPLKVLPVPLRVSVPAPVLVSVPLPLFVPEKVTALPPMASVPVLFTARPAGELIGAVTASVPPPKRTVAPAPPSAVLVATETAP